eukprot:COSAG05_NODE_1364_length_5066_cov_3.492933_2_plen_62_part_00
MRWNGVDCQDGAGCPIALRNLLTANSSVRTSWILRECARARARGSEVTQFYWAASAVHNKS